MKFVYLPVALLAVSSSAFNLLSFSPIPKDGTSGTSLKMSQDGISRRVAISAAVGMSTILGQARPSFAGTTGPSPDELERIKLGYKQIQYLLNNFEQETTVCRENGGECKRNAEPIRRVLGLRSTTDPLFQIEKVFAKVKNLDIGMYYLEKRIDFLNENDDLTHSSHCKWFVCLS
jgi:hypothetical protein